MHQKALERSHSHRAHKIEFIEDDVLASGLKNESAEFVISTFGLKTFNSEQHAELARLVTRVLQAGGVFSMIEAFDPKEWWLCTLYRFYLKKILPLVEKVLLRGAQDFAMIGTYTTIFGDASQFADMLRANGLNVEFKTYFFGCASGVHGIKPSTK